MLKKHLTPLFLRYLLVGFSTVGLDFALFWILLDIFELWYLAAQAITGVIIFGYNFLGHRHFTFQRGEGKKRDQIPRYLLLNAWNYLASLGILWLLVETIGLGPILAKIINIGIIVLWNYQILNRFVYVTLDRDSGEK